MTDALDTGEPQGSSPTSSVPAVSPLNLDRLAEWMVASDRDGFEYCCESALENGLDYKTLKALLARVRALEAVTQAARELVSLGGGTHFNYGRGTVSWDRIERDSMEALRSALAVVDGGGHDGQ